MIESNIKSYDSYTVSQEKIIPEGLPELFSPTDRISHLSKCYEVFPPAYVPGIVRALQTSKTQGASAPYRGGKREFCINASLTPIPVQFNQLGEAQEELIDHLSFKAQQPVIRKIMTLAMNRLAKELDWKDCTQCLSVNAINYKFQAESGEPLVWHSDLLELPIKYTFIVLLSDPQDNESGWTGGDLLYTASKTYNHFQTELEKRLNLMDEIEKTEGEVLNEPNVPIWKLAPSYNDAILFGNIGHQHKVTAMTPKSEKGERMILTVFAFGTPEEIEEQRKAAGII